MTVTFSHPSGCRSTEDSEADEEADEDDHEHSDEDDHEDSFAETKAAYDDYSDRD